MKYLVTTKSGSVDDFKIFPVNRDVSRDSAYSKAMEYALHLKKLGFIGISVKESTSAGITGRWAV